MAIDADEIAEDAGAALASGQENHLAAMRHSAAHMMAAAVMELFPEASWASARRSRTASTTTSTCRVR